MTLNEGLIKRGPNNDYYETPRHLFALWHRHFQFTVDAAADHSNHLLPRYWTENEDGLAKPWHGERVFCNPPYSQVRRWTLKAALRSAEIAVLLLPVRTDTDWFHEDIVKSHAEIWFLRKRVQFLLGGQRQKHGPRFYSMLAIFRQTTPQTCIARSWVYRAEAAVAQAEIQPRCPTSGKFN